MPDSSSIEVERRSTVFAPRGVHWLIDCHGVAAPLLADADALEALLREAASASDARVLSSHFHRFGPAREAGITGVVLLAESHITIHTWPEHGFAAIDLFLCGDTRPERASSHIEKGLLPSRVVTTRADRGASR